MRCHQRAAPFNRQRARHDCDGGGNLSTSNAEGSSLSAAVAVADQTIAQHWLYAKSAYSSVVSASGHGGIPPCPRATKLSRGVRGSCGTRPLRPPASLLHNAALPSVPASRCAKAPLGAGHRFAPCRVKATGVMQSGLRWSRSHSRRRFPVVGTSYAPPSARPCGYRGTWALVRRCALGQWPAASYLVCAPPTLWPRRCAA